MLTLLVFLIFGALLVPEAMATGLLGAESWRTWLYAAMSLTAVRMVPTALALVGARLRWETVLFLGWFGPRGIASVLFGLLVVEKSVLVASHEIFAVVVATVLLSVFLHGATANPLANAYSRRLGAMAEEEGRPEHEEVSEMRPRIRYRAHP